jgi:hypothetical protein
MTTLVVAVLTIRRVLRLTRERAKRATGPITQVSRYGGSPTTHPPGEQPLTTLFVVIVAVLVHRCPAYEPV